MYKTARKISGNMCSKDKINNTISEESIEIKIEERFVNKSRKKLNLKRQM